MIHKNLFIMNTSILNFLIFITTLFSVTVILGQSKSQRNQITSQYDNQKIQQLSIEFKQKTTTQRQYAIKIAKIKNWPLRFEKDGSLLELQRVVDGKPIYFTTFNVDAAKSTRTNHLNSGGSLGLNLNGQNMTAYVWDGGLARTTHQEYDGAGGNNRFSIGDGTTALHFHAAHVTGTIIASGVQASAKGMAPHADAVGFDWNNDTSEATTAAGNGMLISNHSYGFRANQIPDQWFGAYGNDARNWDQIMFNAPNYLMVVAAGNDGNDNSSNGNPLSGNSSYDKLSGHATAKNNLVVANANDANINSNGDLTSVSINSSSSEGPTDDLRIKPDITGNGTGVYSTYESSNTAYNSITGTSMASPNVSGTLVLLQQHANNSNGSFMRAASLKGLALHTADDAGANGPDAVFGWGLLNAKRAASAISDNGNESKIDELTLSSGQTYQITVNSDGINDLLASISWTDRAGTTNSGTNSSTAALVNDIDIRVAKGGTTYNPWRLTGVTTNGKGDNSKDPFERVDVSNASGSYTITVSHKGSLTGGSQNYTLIVTGITGYVTCNATTPTGLTIDSLTSSTASISWNTVTGTTYDLRHRPSGTTTWTYNSITGTSRNITGLSSQTTYQVQVRSKCPNNTTSSYSTVVTFTTAAVPGGSTCSNGITSFPYNEGYENTLGAWTQSSADDINWTIDASGTPSNGTGPSSAFQGSYYVYVEASGNGTGFPNKQAIINSPCYDLTGKSSANFTFKYHMYGSSDMGSIKLEASDDNGVSWTSLWSKTGNLGNSWLSADVNLSAYLGGSVQLRFNRVTGGTWKADVAIDDVKLTANGSIGGGNTNITLSITFDDYPEETSWEIKDSNNQIIASGGTYGSEADRSTLNLSGDFATGCYTFVMKDAYGDGICCSYGNGSYTLTDNSSGSVLVSGGSFSSTDSTGFCLGGATNSYNYVNFDEYEPTIGFDIYPNPAKETLNVSLFGTTSESYEIVNMLGQTVMKGNFEKTVNISNLQDGIYVFKLNIGAKSKIKQFIKQ